MSAFDYLSDSQQKAMLGEVADGGVRRALARRGLAEPDNLTGFQLVTLTNLGRLVMLHRAQRNNRGSQFAVGEIVIYLAFHTNPYPWRFTGGLVRIRTFSESTVLIKYPNERLFWVYPRNVASWNAAFAQWLPESTAVQP